MKRSILSNSQKGNLPDYPAMSNHNRTTLDLKHSIETRPMKPLSNHELTAPVATPLISEVEVDLGPMMCPSYLSSPMETILESLNDHDMEYICPHDIIEAYSVFSSRIRSQAHELIRPAQPLSALAPVKEHAASLAHALKRDIRRALFDPSHNSRKSPLSYESYHTDVSISDHEIEYARNTSTLCHHSLRVLSDVFAFSTLYSFFSVRDLQDLLSDLLKIALSTALPTPNANKTWSLVFWTIQVQNLPSKILSTRKAEIVMGLRQALNGERGIQAKLDSLKAMHTLLKRQPDLFASSLSPFLPAILVNLTSEDADFRIHSAYALSGLTLAKLSMLASSEFPHEATSQAIHTFIKAQTSPSEPSQGELRLPNLLSQAFASSRGKAPFWAVVVPACMIVLSDYSLFLRHSLKFCVHSFRPAFNHKYKEIRALHAPVWRTLVWAFSRLPVDRTWLQPEDPDIPDQKIGVKGRAFRVLRQEVGSGKGVALVGALLRPGVSGGRDADAATVGDVSRALLVVKAMISEESQADTREGVLVLHRLVSAVGVPLSGTGEARDQGGDSVDLELGLFDGTLLDAVPDRIKQVMRSMAEVKIDRIRRLSEGELVQHWDGLMEVWADAVERSLQEVSPQSLRELLDIWQSLLLLKADLTQEHGHLTGSASFAGQLAGIVNRFLVHSAEVDGQVRRLTTITKLWGVMKNVYSLSWLPAESILAAVLKVQFSLHQERVRSAWSQVCADLISVGVPTVLHIVFTGSEREEGREVTRLLWSVLARSWRDKDEKLHWEEMASFLVIPFKAWNMSESELELWEGLLRSAVALAGSIAIGPSAVVDRMLQRMGEKELDAFVLFPRGVAGLLAHVSLSGSTALPAKMLAVVDRTLISNYPPRAEALAGCLKILRLLGQVISSTPVALLVPLLCALEKGMCCWIGDEKEVMLGTEHSKVVEDLYCPTVDLLSSIPGSLETLISISPFLSSAFGRLTPSAVGPLAFNRFWRATYHGIEDYKPSYPDCLRACLLGFADAFGGSIADGLSYGESQITGMSTIPDSQPSYHGRDDSCIIFGQAIEDPSLSPLQPRSLTPTPMRERSPEPPTKRRKLEYPTAFQQLEDYSSQQDGNASGSKTLDPGARGQTAPLRPSFASIPGLSQEVADNSPFGLSTPRPTPQTLPIGTEPPPAPSQKRPSSLPAERRSPKRRKTESDLPRSPVRQDAPRRQSDTGRPESSLLQPSSPMEPLSPGLHDSVSQNTDTRKRKRIIDWVSVSMNIEDSAPRGGESQLSGLGASSLEDLNARPSTPPAEDYDSWEAGVSMEEIIQLQRELVGSDDMIPVPETDLDECDDVGGTEPASDREDDKDLLNPSSGLSTRPGQQPQRRSQTTPGAIPQVHLGRPKAPVLRRNQTTSARMDALERAYTAVTNNASQIPVADLVHATGLVNRIQTALNEQLTRRLGPGSDDKS